MLRLARRERSMGRGWGDEMIRQKHTIKMVREGEYVADVEVDLIESDDDWAPYLSVEDAQRLDTVREALRCGDIRGASEWGRLFRMVLVVV